MFQPTGLALRAVLFLSLAGGAAAQSGRVASLRPSDATAPSGCVAGWVDSFGSEPGVNGQLQDMLEFDDGSGPALYVAGYFTSAGSVSARSVARWDGSAWSPLGEGLNGIVYELAVYDDGLGGGPALYAGGAFTLSGISSVSRIARWDGSSWSALGSGMNNLVYSLGVHAGSLYAGGTFTTAGGVLANHVARWNGSSWSALGAAPPPACTRCSRSMTAADWRSMWAASGTTSRPFPSTTWRAGTAASGATWAAACRPSCGRWPASTRAAEPACTWAGPSPRRAAAPSR
jgi:hypothetical protein